MNNNVTYGFTDLQYEKFPPVVQIALVSGVCPSNCTYCPMGMKNKAEISNTFAGELPVKYFSADLFQKIAKEMVEYPFSILRIHSRGEPMCHPQYTEMITYAKKVGVKVVTSFTNGIYLKKHISELINAPIDLLEISADAANSTLYQKWRRNPYFDDIVEGVRELFNTRNKCNRRTRIVISAVDHPEFRPHRASFETFWKPLCDKVIIRPFHTYAGRIKNPYQCEHNKTYIPCVQLWERFSVSPDGLTNACFNDWGDKEVIGDLKSASIANIWRNEIFENIRIAALNAPTLQCCKECSGSSLSSWGKDGYQHWVHELLGSPANNGEI